jgi:hypothetical protein
MSPCFIPPSDIHQTNMGDARIIVFPMGQPEYFLKERVEKITGEFVKEVNKSFCAQDRKTQLVKNKYCFVLIFSCFLLPPSAHMSKRDFIFTLSSCTPTCQLAKRGGKERHFRSS